MSMHINLQHGFKMCDSRTSGCIGTTLAYTSDVQRDRHGVRQSHSSCAALLHVACMEQLEDSDGADDPVTSVRNLGVTMDSSLSFLSHVSHVVSSSCSF